jgi:hypothetical protein
VDVELSGDSRLILFKNATNSALVWWAARSQDASHPRSTIIC